MATLTPADVAADLQFDSVETVMRYLREGVIPGRKVGRYWRIDAAAYEAWKATPTTPDEYRIEPRSTRGQANLRRRAS